MSSSIYEEALADVKKLKEVAEQNAKNAIIDAVTPKIREMIEKQLIGDDSVDEGDVLNDLAESLFDEDAEDVQLTSESLKALSGLVNSGGPSSVKDAELNSLLVQERLLIIMDETGVNAPDINSLVEMKNEIVSTYATLVENRADITNADFERIQKRLASLDHFLNEAIGENEMNERDLRSILDEEALRLVLDLGDEVEFNPEDVAVSVEAAEEEEVAAEDDDALDVESEELSAEEVVSDTPAGEDDDATLGESDDEDLLEINEDQLASMIRSILNEDDGEDLDETSEITEGDDDVDESLEMSDEQDLDEDRVDPASEESPVPAQNESALSDDTVVEISESMLRDELSRMRRLRESSAPATTTESNNGKGTSGEVAQLKAQLQEYQKAVSSLRGQLDESNLFNAKLLYANKLLQSRDLSDRQRVNIVESLDSAKSLREVRLLYKSLTESVDTNKGNLTESKRRRAAGSASRPTRTGSVSKTSESYPENDRWALLAGLNK